MASESGTGLRLACFDAGGMRALSQARMMETLMYRIQYDLYPNDPEKVVLPCEVFDMIGGSDTGGLLAIMYGKLRMSAAETLEELHTICSQVYLEALSPEERSDHLRKFLEDLLERRKLPKDLKLEQDTRMVEEGCPCFVVAVHKRSVTTKATLRNYRSRSQMIPNLTIIDAVLATCAAQPLFSPVSVGQALRKQEYIGAAMGTGNPLHELVTEAHQHFKLDSYISTILSIGSGHSGIISIDDLGDGNEGSTLMRSVMENSERVYQDARSQYGHFGILFRLSVEQGLQGSVDEKESPLEAIMSHTESYLLGDEISERVDHCLESLRLRQGRATLDQLKRSGTLSKVYKTLPPLTTFFVMRQEPWNRMNQILNENQAMQDQRIMVVSGLDGCGKTTLVTHFAKHYKDRFQFTFYIDGNSKESIQADILGYVRASDNAHSQSSFNDSLKFFYDTKNLPWLLIYDNVDDIDLDMPPLMPNCSHGIIVITTRNRMLGQLASPPHNHIELDVMSETEAVDVILQSTRLNASRDEQASALEIADELGHLPIALTQAGSYIRETSCGLRDYLARLRVHKEELLNMPAHDRQHRSTYAAFDLSYQRLPTRAQQFLNIIACFHFANFPLVIISFAEKSSFQEDQFQLSKIDSSFEDAVHLLTAIFCPDGQWNDIAFDRMLALLQSYSLASVTASPLSRLLRVHKLLHQFIASKMTPEQRASYQCACARLVACSAEEVKTNFLITPHVDALPFKSPDGPIGMNDRAACAAVLSYAGRHKDALPVWENLYQAVTQLYGPTSLEVATAALWMADCFREDLSKMETLEKEVVRIREEILGVNHRDTNQAKTNLAMSYRAEERYDETSALQQEVLDILMQAYGPLDKDVLRAMADLASTYYLLSKYTEAQQLQKIVLEKRKQVLGDEDYDTIDAMDCLVLTYSAQNKYEDAAQLQEMALELWTKRVGDEHNSTVEATSQLAMVYYDQRRYSDALPLEENVLKYRRQNLGDKHPDTALAMNNLGWTYYCLGRIAEARELAVEAEPIRKSRYGVLHKEYKKTANLLRVCDEALVGADN